MKQLFFVLLILFSGTLLFAGTPFSPAKPDSATSLSAVKESYKLSGHHLAALAQKVRYKETPQEDLYLYILRPQIKSGKALPAIVYFTGGGWVAGNVYGQIPNPAWFRDHGIIGIEADYRGKIAPRNNAHRMYSGCQIGHPLRSRTCQRIGNRPG